MMEKKMLFKEKESSTLEFKQDIPKNNQIVKTVIGFANQFGGKLLIGINDNGSIIGIPANSADELTDSLFKLIYDNTVPPILPSIYSLRFEDKLVLVIEVSKGMNKPYFVKSEGLNDGTYIRLGAMTVKANAEIIDELQQQSRGISYDILPLYNASVKDLDFSKIEAFLQKRKNGTKKVAVTNDILKAYSLITEEHTRLYPTVCGMLLFGKDPQNFLPQSYTICAQFSGHIGREGIITTKDCVGNLFQQFESTFDWLWNTLNKSSEIKGLRRKDSLEVPEIAIREALLNSFLHRNWRIQGPNRICVYPTRIEFFSPGVFPGPLNIGQLELGMTRSRNHAIMKIFREAGYIESLGSGFPSIFNSYRKAGLDHPQVIEGVEFVKCILPRSKFQESGDPRCNMILSILTTKDSLTKRDVMQAITISTAGATRLLAELTKNKTLKRHGSGPTTYYTLYKKK